MHVLVLVDYLAGLQEEHNAKVTYSKFSCFFLLFLFYKIFSEKTVCTIILTNLT